MINLKRVRQNRKLIILQCAKPSYKIAFMKNNYNYKINQQPLDKGNIDKHKDFDALMKRVEAANPPPKNQLKVASKKLYMWAGGIAAALLIGFFALSNLFQNQSDYPAISSAYFAEQPFVNPPVKQLEKKAEVVTVNANDGGVYQFPSGSKMVVPKAAFANKYGALIEGEVEIHFKEYHDYVDFFLSGIPMEIKVDGKDGVLESAGMIEVYATQNGERLSMLPEKPIDIELKSKIAFAGDTPPAFNIYYLDEDKRAWDLQGKDKIEIEEVDEESKTIFTKDNQGDIIGGKTPYVKVIGDPNDENFTGAVTYDTAYIETENSLLAAAEAQKENLQQKSQAEIAQVDQQFKLPAQPEKPELYDGNSMTMELDIKGENLGTKNYEGTIFQVLTVINAFDDFSTTVWEEFDLVRQADASFDLNLTKGDKKKTLKVKPVLVGQDYDKALQQFETQLADYQKEKEKIAQEIATKKQEIAERLAIEQAASDKSFAERIAALKARGHNNYATNEILKRTVVNNFQINRFGIWNCDRPRPAYLAVLAGTFQDESFNRFRKNVVYQTDKSQNTVRRFYINDIANVQFNTESDNLLWLVTEENKLAVFYPEYFERIQKKNGDYAFEMDLNPKEINSEADVRSILRL